MRLLFLLAFIIAFASCKQSTSTAEHNALATYFTYGDSIESGGVRMIPIATPVGTFNVWTKRFGSNPKTKLLLFTNEEWR